MNRKRGLFLVLAFGLSLATAEAADFFKIQEVNLHDEQDSRSVVEIVMKEGKQVEIHHPTLEVKVTVAQDIKSRGLIGKAYFYDRGGNSLGSAVQPARRIQRKEEHYKWPVFMKKGKPENLLYPIPAAAVGKEWKAVLVFGDAKEVTTKVYPTGFIERFEFAEKQLAVGKPGSLIAIRKAAIDPVVENVIKTRNPRHPVLTLFLRMPNGVKRSGELKGVLAYNVLANRVEDVKRMMQKADEEHEASGLCKWADRKRFAIIAWGGGRVWNPHVNYDALPLEEARAYDETFDDLAEAWERGTTQLVEKYGLPEEDWLLRGTCGAAQWAHRLALRKPDRFLAVHVHIPGSFDAPTEKARRIMWLLTTGELYGGYTRSLTFLKDCRRIGYPIVYKAFMMMGHGGGQRVNDLSNAFFDYALGWKAQRDAAPESPLNNTTYAAAEAFSKSEYVGDAVNQVYFPAAEMDQVPEPFRVALPTKTLATAWDR